MILDTIIEHKKREVKEKKNARYLADLKTTIRDLPAPIGFRVNKEIVPTLRNIFRNRSQPRDPRPFLARRLNGFDVENNSHEQMAYGL